jgi:zinc transporter 2
MEAKDRIVHPQPVHGKEMLGLAVFGIFANMLMISILGHGHVHADHNNSHGGHHSHGSGHGHGHGHDDVHGDHASEDHDHRAHGHGHHHDINHGHGSGVADVDLSRFRRTSFAFWGKGLTGSAVAVHVPHDDRHCQNEGQASEHGIFHTASAATLGTSGGTSSLAYNAALMHVVGDFVQSIGVLVAAALIWYEPVDIGHVITPEHAQGISRWIYVDPACTLLFTIIAVAATIPTVRLAMDEILLSAPEHDSRALLADLRRLPDVQRVRDLHFWKMSGSQVLSAHIEVSQQADPMLVLEQLQEIATKAKIYHSTFQLQTDAISSKCRPRLGTQYCESTRD